MLRLPDGRAELFGNASPSLPDRFGAGIGAPVIRPGADLPNRPMARLAPSADPCCDNLREGAERADELHDPLAQLSDALAARTEAAQAFVVAIRTLHHVRSGMLWGGDVVVASEQVFPKANEAEIRLMDGRDMKATLAGRDPGTNVVALRLDQPVEISLPASVEKRLG